MTRRWSVRFAWYDLWMGAFWDRKARVLYVCPLPTLLVVIPWGEAPPEPSTVSVRVVSSDRWSGPV